MGVVFVLFIAGVVALVVVLVRRLTSGTPTANARTRRGDAGDALAFHGTTLSDTGLPAGAGQPFEFGGGESGGAGASGSWGEGGGEAAAGDGGDAGDAGDGGGGDGGGGDGGGGGSD